MEDPVYMAMPVSELPQPYVSSTRAECSVCNDAVWVDMKARDLAESMPIVCRPCFLERYTVPLGFG